ncbi:5977_t:CDS:1, partial [Funneliformis mosseae]
APFEQQERRTYLSSNFTSACTTPSKIGTGFTGFNPILHY